MEIIFSTGFHCGPQTVAAFFFLYHLQRVKEVIYLE